MRALRCLLAVIACCFAPTLAAAQKYPTKLVRIISANPPGGSTDPLLRVVVDVLSKAIGGVFVIEHRPGADGALMSEECARAAPDGHTLCLGDSYSFILNPMLNPNSTFRLDRVVPIIHLGSLPSGLWSRASLKADTADALFRALKGKPESLNWASFGGSSKVYISYIKQTAGLSFAEVPYKTAIDAWRAVVNGEADVAIFNLQAGITQSGNIANMAERPKLLGINATARLQGFPDVPVFKEIGLGDPLLVWFGLFAPAGTPKAIVETLNTEIAKGLFGDPDRLKLVTTTMGMDVSKSGRLATEFSALMDDDAKAYASKLAASKFKPGE